MRLVIVAAAALSVLAYSQMWQGARADETSPAPAPAAVPGPATDPVPAVPPLPPVPPKPQPEELVGQPAPDFTLTDMDGQEHHLADLRGKTVLLDWFNPVCPAVKAYYEKPEIVAQFNAALTGQEDVVWLSINSGAPGKEGNDAEVNKAFAGAVGKTNPILADESGAVGHNYHAWRTPTVYVINPAGVVVYAGTFDQATSARDAPLGDMQALAAVEASRKGELPVVSTAKPFG